MQRNDEKKFQRNEAVKLSFFLEQIWNFNLILVSYLYKSTQISF